MAVQIQYQDIDILMKKDSFGDISVVTNDDAINQSIAHILNTTKGEQLWDPQFGSNLKFFLFEKISPITANLIRQDIEYALKNYEPRISIVEILVEPEEDKYQYNISVTYEIVRLNSLAQTSIVLQVQ
jgi:phage baseplate assembly protein W